MQVSSAWALTSYLVSSCNRSLILIKKQKGSAGEPWRAPSCYLSRSKYWFPLLQRVITWYNLELPKTAVFRFKEKILKLCKS